MVNAVQDKAGLIDDKLIVSDPITILSRTNGVAVDSKAVYDKAQSLGATSCDVNDVKLFTFLGSERAEDHCDWVDNTATNPFSDSCSFHIRGGLDVQGLVAKGKTNAVVHGKPDTMACNSGPAMVLGFNDQSPQYLAYADLAAFDVKMCPDGTTKNKLGQTLSKLPANRRGATLWALAASRLRAPADGERAERPRRASTTTSRTTTRTTAALFPP